MPPVAAGGRRRLWRRQPQSELSESINDECPLRRMPGRRPPPAGPPEGRQQPTRGGERPCRPRDRRCAPGSHCTAGQGQQQQRQRRPAAHGWEMAWSFTLHLPPICPLQGPITRPWVAVEGTPPTAEELKPLPASARPAAGLSHEPGLPRYSPAVRGSKLQAALGRKGHVRQSAGRRHAAAQRACGGTG